MRLSKSWGVVIAASALFPMSSPIYAEGGYPIAGLRSDQRPSGAPFVTNVAKSDSWYGAALTGLQAPYPPSFRFLEDQGDWYTPFSRPGMTGPYDIRGWHEAKPK